MLPRKIRGFPLMQYFTLFEIIRATQMPRNKVQYAANSQPKQTVSITTMNLFKPDQAEGQVETFDTLLEHPHVTIERILSPPETVTETEAQPHDEWVCVLQGSARLEMEGRVIHLHRGDQVLIPAHTPHRVLTTSHRPHCLWLAVHIR